MPKISVIMPVYNGGNYLSESIESILNQTERDFEFLILNEFGSDDGSAEVIEHYAQQDRRVKFIQAKEHMGITRSLNYLLNESKGEYIARMDSDDLSAPRRFEIQLLYLDLYKDIDVIGIKHRVIGRDTWQVRYHSDWRILRSETLLFIPIRHPTMMIRSEVIKRYNLYYDETLDGAEDIEIQQRIGQVAKMMNVNDPSLFTYRVHGNNAAQVSIDRDNNIHRFLIKRFSEKLFKIKLSDYDCRLLSFTSGIKLIQGDEQIAACQHLEFLLKQFYNLNLDRKIFDNDALSFTLFHRWIKEKQNIQGEYGGYKNAPKSLRDFFEESPFFKLRTYERFSHESE